MSRTLHIVSVFDVTTCLHDGYDVSQINKITIEAHLMRSLTADQVAVLKRLRARIRKRLSRQGSLEVLLPLPAGTAQALERVMQAAGFDDPRDFFAFQVHRLDRLRECDGHSFNQQAVRTVTVGDLSKYHDRLGGDSDDSQGDV